MDADSKPTILKTVRITFAVSIVALALITFIAFINFNRLLNRADWVDHTNIVLLKLESIISKIKDAETGQRGYLLTRNPDFLEPYINSYEGVFKAYNEVRELTVDNRLQQLRLDTLKVLIGDKYELINTTIELEKRQHLEENRQLASVRRGKEVMDRIRAVIDRMRDEEIRLRFERTEAVKSSSYITPFFIFIISAFGLVISLIAYYVIIKDVKKRLQAEELLTLTNYKLEQTNEELLTREEQLNELTAKLEEKVEARTNEVIIESNRRAEAEDRYRYLVESIKDYAIFILSPEGNISTWNKGAETLIGYTQDEILNHHFRKFYLPEETYKTEINLTKAIQEGRCEDEGWRVRKDGSKFWANTLITPIYKNNNTLMGFSKITRDLTDRKKAEDSLRRINNDLDNFIYTASHDLKAPINNMEGLLNAIYDNIQNNCAEEVKSLFDMIKLSIEKLKSVISDLSDISRVQKGIENDKEKINLNNIIEDFKITHERELQFSKTTIETDFKVEEIYFSRKNLNSILSNLLINAIRYKSPNRDPRIQIRTSETSEAYKIEVEDNGLGIEAENKDKIFKMFKRLHAHVPGTGIGLYIVKRILENNNGTIKVDSTLGVGTTFIIQLPKKVI